MLSCFTSSQHEWWKAHYVTWFINYMLSKFCSSQKKKYKKVIEKAKVMEKLSIVPFLSYAYSLFHFHHMHTHSLCRRYHRRICVYYVWQKGHILHLFNPFSLENWINVSLFCYFLHYNQSQKHPMFDGSRKKKWLRYQKNLIYPKAWSVCWPHLKIY